MPIKHTPLVAQYLSVKQKAPSDALLLFRLGDFYEMFFEDAEVGARVLDIQLTSRSKDGVPLCGVPYHAAENYIAKLLKAGYKVAICEQGSVNGGAGSSPKGGAFQLNGAADARAPGRGLMPRQIVRVITPGTVGEELVLTADEKNFLLAIAADDAGFAMAALEISTGEFITTRVVGLASLREEAARLAPREILAPEEPKLLAALSALKCPLTRLASSAFDVIASRELLTARFGSTIADCSGATAAAAGAALRYAEENFGGALAHIGQPRSYSATEFMLIDETTRGHLELVVISEGGRQGSLLSILDETLTPIGARALASWLTYPLMDLNAIARRHDAVEELFDCDLSGEIAAALKRVGDLERLAGRIGSLRASPRDVLKLGAALGAVGALQSWLGGRRSAALIELTARLDPIPELVALIDATLHAEPPTNPRDGNTICAGFSAEVDELRTLARDARSVIARIEAAERERTQIPSLKVRYNQIFGYYIEVTKAHLERAPADYERTQTLVGAERFTTPALKELERKILSAETGLKALELQLFTALLRELCRRCPSLLRSAAALGEIDALRALAAVARRRGYVRPAMDSGHGLMVRDGRHPVLEAGMRSGEFVPNDLEADPETRQLLLITGPNMAGKSTFLRQVALIVIMAQIGSFVPATQARLGLCDRVLTRIGARDELRRGESTFMVEMRETARLLEDLTARSLLLLDEVGRGTSTFDGLAIAWAVAEHLHDRTQAKVLFATHFHELTALARERERVKNLSMAVREWKGEVHFLRRVIEGPASRSYGIEVARLAGVPPSVVARAREILSTLERGELRADLPARSHQTTPPQLDLFAATRASVIAEIEQLDCERLTPLDALTTLARWAHRLRDG